MNEPSSGTDSTEAPSAPRATGDDVELVEWEHLVQFYETDDFLCDSIAGFLSDGLVMGDPLVVLATKPHRDAVAARLAEAGVDWEEARRSGRLNWMDARHALEMIMVGRTPDQERFDVHIGGLIRAATRDGTRRVRAYGELVDILWQEGNSDQALALEDMWNGLGRTYSFSLLCAYSRGNVYRESRSGQYHRVCERHQRVMPHENPDRGAAGRDGSPAPGTAT